MTIITDVDKANDILEQEHDLPMQVSFYTPSLKRIALKLISTGKDEVVYLIGIGCESMSGKFALQKANLKITVSTINDMKDYRTAITDKDGKFELITLGGFSLAIGKEYEFGDSFDNFLNPNSVQE